MRFLALALLALVALPARAQDNPVVTSLDAEAVARLVREAASSFGVRLNTQAHQAPDSTFVIAVDATLPGVGAETDTLRFFASLDDCAGEACGTLSTVIFFGLQDGHPTLAEVNRWNADHRFTRAYLSDESVTLQADLGLQDGVTAEAVRGFVRTYLLSLAAFLDGDDGAPAGAP